MYANPQDFEELRTSGEWQMTDRAGGKTGSPQREALNVLRPGARDCIQRFGYSTTLAALISLYVSEAIAWDKPYEMAEILFLNADLLANSSANQQGAIAVHSDWDSGHDND